MIKLSSLITAHT